MKRHALETIEPGQFLARPVVDHAGRVLLNAGASLTKRYLSTLADKGFRYLFVRGVAPPYAESPAVSPTPAAHVAAAKAVVHAFTTVHRELGGRELKPLADHQRWCAAHAAEELGGGGGVIQSVYDSADAFLAEMEGGGRSPSPILQHAHENSIGEHSVRVAKYCLVMGEACGLSAHMMQQLAAGALLHDIGKAFSVAEPGSDAGIVCHTTLGFELLRACDTKGRMAPSVAYEHHEYQDGTGLPRGLVGSNRIERNRNSIPVPTLIGEIAAIANDYDRLVAGDDPIPPDWALDILRGHAGTRYNEELVKLFVREVMPYPLGEDVLVSSGPHQGCTAIVRAINPRYASKPIVTVYLDAGGKSCQPVELDLLNDSSLSVRGRPFR